MSFRKVVSAGRPLCWSLAAGMLVWVAGVAGCHRGPTTSTEDQGNSTPVASDEGKSQESASPSVDAPSRKSSPVGEPCDPVSELKQEAFQVARQLIADFPEAAESVAVLALVQDRYGRSAEALESWERCLELNSRFASAYHGMGTIVRKRGDDEEAVRLFRKALSLNPMLRGCHEDLADALMSQGAIIEASTVLEEGVVAGVRSAGAYFRLGQAYVLLKQFEKAKENFQASIDTDPDAYSSYYGLAGVCARLGQREESRNILKQYSRLKEKARATETERLRSFDDIQSACESVAFFHNAAAQVYDKHGNLHKAEEHWLRSASLVPTETVGRIKLAQLYQRQNRWPEAITILEQLCRVQPEEVPFRMNLGNVRMLALRFDAAERDFREVCKLAPDSSLGYSSLAQLLVRRNRNLDEANMLAEKAVKLKPNAANYFVLSLARASNGDRSGALAAVENALRRAPDNSTFRQLYETLQATP